MNLATSLGSGGQALARSGARGQAIRGDLCGLYKRGVRPDGIGLDWICRDWIGFLWIGPDWIGPLGS